MTQERCESVFDNGKLISRCVLEKGHSGRHAYPNLTMKKEDRELFDFLQTRKTPYRYSFSERYRFSDENDFR